MGNISSTFAQNHVLSRIDIYFAAHISIFHIYVEIYQIIGHSEYRLLFYSTIYFVIFRYLASATAKTVVVVLEVNLLSCPLHIVLYCGRKRKAS